MTGAGGGRGGGGNGNYTNPCLTMHQPWASLLVHGIKRIEGRSWPSPIRGMLWIHAASKIPDDDTIKAMEDFYREIYAVNGVSDLKFPEHYPVSRLIGCVDIVGCIRSEELANWDAVPEGVRLEGQTDFCWLCEKPQKLLVPFEMRGYQRVYNLEKKIHQAAVRALIPVKGPLPVQFPLPHSTDKFSLKPGSISVDSTNSKPTTAETSSSLCVAIAGARAAATQFSKMTPIVKSSVGTAVANANIDERFNVIHGSSNLSEQMSENEWQGNSNSGQDGSDADIIQPHTVSDESSIENDCQIGHKASMGTSLPPSNLVERSSGASSMYSASKHTAMSLHNNNNGRTPRELPYGSTNRPHLTSNKLFSAAIGKLGH